MNQLETSRTSRRTIAVALVASFLGLLAACSPSKEDVSEAAKAALTHLFATNPATKDLNLTIGKVDLVTVEPDKRFQGIAVVTREGQIHEVKIDVISDGENVLVTPDPMSLAQILPAGAGDEAFAQELTAGAEEAAAFADEAADAAAAAEAGADDAVKSMETVFASAENAPPPPAAAAPSPQSAIEAGRYVSGDNALLILSSSGKIDAAVLQLGVANDPSCIEGAVDCVTMEGTVSSGSAGLAWVSNEDGNVCELPLTVEKDAMVLTLPKRLCRGFGSANNHLAVTMAGRYTRDEAADYSPSFPCAKAGSAVEKMTCATPVLGFLDNALARKYKAHLAGSSDSSASRSEQRAWVAERDKCVDARCVMGAYLDRLYRLQ